MSSQYRILCLSHDPAIIFGPDDWYSPEPALAAVANRDHPATRQHADCDLLVGRYSYPLVEICCPRSTPIGSFHRGCHSDDRWLDADWLRLLASAGNQAQNLRPGCWTYETARRLRFELGIENAEGDAS